MNYPRLGELAALCRSFVGKRITLTANFNGRATPIANPNLVGDLLEDIFFPFFKESFPDFEEGPKQDPPDYFAGGREYFFEQKVFCESPGFDISNFTSFISQISQPGGLMKKVFKTKYLVFEYRVEGSEFVIKNFWLLDIWNLPNYDLKNPISVQIKKGMWYNLRPGSSNSWTSPAKTPQKFFDSLLKCMDQCAHLENKDGLKQSILQQMEEAKTQGLL